VRRACAFVLGAVAVVGALAPFFAGDAPLVARAGGELRFPAFAAAVGRPAPPPAGETWLEWWTRLDADDADWALFPPVPFDPAATAPAQVNAPPSWLHPLGNDDTGRDVCARLVHGARTATWVAVAVVLLAAAFGIPAGAVAGLRGGVLDSIMLRLVELCTCFPALLLVLAIAAFAGGSELAVIAVPAFVYWTSFARVVRGELLSLREREFVLAARGLGIGTAQLFVRHLLPIVLGPILVVAGFVAANAIAVESTLRFLGLGASLDRVSWGAMLAQGRQHAHTGAWHLWVVPSVALAATVLSLHALFDPAVARRARRAGEAGRYD
jgi:peptide/nickel transport system permease protein